MTATLTITFTNVNPGLSKLTAIHKGERKTVKQSDEISFGDVESGDLILIQGKSLGTTNVKIDVSADPAEMNFDPGKFNDNFSIN
jgi:hypothetical protein